MSQEAGSEVRQVTLNVDVGYAESALGIIKVIQFVFLLITWACMADCCSASGVMFGARYGFYLFVTIFGWLCIIFLYVWFLLMLTDKVKLPASMSDIRIVVAIFEISWAFLLLISASLVAEVANYFGVLKAHVGVKQFYNTMATAVAFGFFTFVVFIVDMCSSSSR